MLQGATAEKLTDKKQSEPRFKKWIIITLPYIDDKVLASFWTKLVPLSFTVTVCVLDWRDTDTSGILCCDKRVSLKSAACLVIKGDSLIPN